MKKQIIAKKTEIGHWCLRWAFHSCAFCCLCFRVFCVCLLALLGGFMVFWCCLSAFWSFFAPCWCLFVAFWCFCSACCWFLALSRSGKISTIFLFPTKSRKLSTEKRENHQILRKSKIWASWSRFLESSRKISTADFNDGPSGANLLTL